MPAEGAAVELVQAAIKAGISWIDAARAYGQSERRIGAALADAGATVHVVTKLDPLAHVAASAPVETAVAAAAASLAASREALACTKIDTFLLHRASHLTMWGGAVWRMLVKERNAGGIGKLGVSVQSPQEAFAALADANVAHLQMPFSILDHRWDESNVVAALRKRPDVVVHVRSVLLQGLLAGTPHARWPRITGITPDELLGRLGKLAAEFHRDGLVDLCIAFVRAQDWVDGIVIGMETIEQLNTNLALFARPPLSPDHAMRIRASLPHVPDALLDPAQWPSQ
jgi:spore coat polysaccharide biosynthesis protein SpsF